MSRSLITIGLFLVLVGSSSSSPPALDAAARHSVRGSGRDAQGPFRIRADGTPSQATGRASFDFGPSGVLAGTVDCLFVDGRRAVLGGAFDAPLGGLPYFKIIVKDDRKDRPRPRDLYYAAAVSGPVDCPTADQPVPQTYRIRRGDIVVA